MANGESSGNDNRALARGLSPENALRAMNRPPGAPKAFKREVLERQYGLTPTPTPLRFPKRRKNGRKSGRK